MATLPQIALLRQYINEPDDTAPYDAVALSNAIDANGGDVELTAGQMWDIKASGFAELVDVQEGSSRRSLGSLQANAIKMADFYRGRSSTGIVASGRTSRTRRIERQ